MRGDRAFETAQDVGVRRTDLPPFPHCPLVRFTSSCMLIGTSRRELNATTLNPSIYPERSAEPFGHGAARGQLGVNSTGNALGPRNA